MDSADESDSIFDSSADLFDDVETIWEQNHNNKTEQNHNNKTMVSQPVLNFNNQVNIVGAQAGRQTSHLETSINIIHSTDNSVKSTISSCHIPDVRPEKIKLLNGCAEKCYHEYSNSSLCNEPTFLDEVSPEDNLQGNPNKRHKLCELEEEELDNGDMDLVILNVSNHSSDKLNSSTLPDDITENSEEPGRSVDKVNTEFVTSLCSSSVNGDVNMRHNLGEYADSSTERMMEADNSNYSVMSGVDHVSLHTDMTTTDCTRDFKGNLDSDIQTTSLSQKSSSLMLKGSDIICPFCGLHQHTLHLMENHIETMHSEFNNDNTEAALVNGRIFSNAEESDFLFVCPFCDLDLGDRVTLDLHLLAIHEEEQNVQSYEQETCPLCGAISYSEESMKCHIQTHSNSPTFYGISEGDQGAVFAASTASSVMTCPVCFLEMSDSDLLVSHVESHFNSSHQLGQDSVKGASSKQHSNKGDATKTNSAINMKDLPEYRKDIESRSTNIQNNAPSTSKASSSSSRDNVSYKRQFEQNLEKAVTRGQMSITDYHEQKLLMAETEMMGVDNGSTRTQGLIEKLELLYRSQARNGQVAYFCSPTDHYIGSYGDKGWGCGYRNFQILLSCLCRHRDYARTIFGNNNMSIPSIPKIQQMIESAWKKGFDPQGCAQLGGRLVNTSKWIGATEIVATLLSLGVKCLLFDCHAPSAPDGTHPRLLKWVYDYFRTQQHGFLPPLYLQHQGHSRTIVGVERENESVKLLLFDPGTPRDQMVSIDKERLSWKHMRAFRRTQAGFRSKQYQIMVVAGLLTADEYEGSKILKSEQVS